MSFASLCHKLHDFWFCGPHKIDLYDMYPLIYIAWPNQLLDM